MSHWVYGIDLSYDEISDADVARLKAAGVRVAVQCLWTGREQPGPRVTNLRRLKNAGGIALAGYISVTPHRDGAWHVDQGRAGVPDDIWAALKRVPVDVELPGLTADTVRRAVERVRALGKPRDIYTNWNTWVNVLGNPRTFTDCGLWNANWDGAPDFDFPRLPFGGWRPEQVWGEQWSGGTNVSGVFADRNQFRAEAFGIDVPAPPARPEPPARPAPAVATEPTPPPNPAVRPFVILLRKRGTAPVFMAHVWQVPDRETLDALRRAGVPGPVEL